MISAIVLPALLGLASALPPLNTFDPRQSYTCQSGVHVIATGGGNSTDFADLGLLLTLATNITAAIPNSDYVSIAYNKTDVNAAQIAAGDVMFNAAVNGYHAACPNGKIVLIGYSSGAIITMNSVCGSQPPISQSLADSTVIATVVYGDQTRVAGLSYDLGTCTGNGNLTRVRNPSGCGDFASGIQSYCDTNDPQCCDGPPEDYMIHFVYPSKYDLVATQWVVSRWNQLGNGASISGSSSSSSSASATSMISSSTMSMSSSTSSASISGTGSSSSISSSSSVPYTNTSSTSVPVVTSTVTQSMTTPSSTSSMASTTSTVVATSSPTLSPSTGGAAATIPSFPMAIVLAIGALAMLC